jgi:dolichol-phosphate mannosyltransferase
MRVSVILPTINERDNLVELLPRLFALPLDLEVIVVDDASTDGTALFVREQGRTYHMLRCMERPQKMGLASAVMDGFSAAAGEVLVAMDADLSHDEKILPALVAAIEDGADVAVGSRFVEGGGMEGWPRRRQAASALATAVARVLLHVRAHDPMSGYFAVRREVFDRVRPRLRPRGYKILLEILVRAAPLRVAEVGFIFVDRVRGKSKLSTAVAREYGAMILSLLFRR